MVTEEVNRRLPLQRIHQCRPSWPAALPGGLRGGESGSTGLVAGIGRRPVPFRQHRDVLLKAQHHLADWPGKRQAGCRFLLVTSPLDKIKISDSGRAATQKPLLLTHPLAASASMIGAEPMPPKSAPPDTTTARASGSAAPAHQSSRSITLRTACSASGNSGSRNSPPGARSDRKARGSRIGSWCRACGVG
jgi:hypothetical protein